VLALLYLRMELIESLWVCGESAERWLQGADLQPDARKTTRGGRCGRLGSIFPLSLSVCVQVNDLLDKDPNLCITKVCAIRGKAGKNGLMWSVPAGFVRGLHRAGHGAQESGQSV